MRTISKKHSSSKAFNRILAAGYKPTTIPKKKLSGNYSLIKIKLTETGYNYRLLIPVST